MDLQRITEQAEKAVRQAGDFILQEAKTFDKAKINDKGVNQLVSYVDITAEKMLVESLKNLLPEAGFITEENTIATDRLDYNWVIDPLDGTTNYVHGIPVYCISVALIRGDEELIGIVHELGRNECFTAWKGGGAFMNGSPISVSKSTVLRESLLATGFPYYDFEKINDYLALLSDLMRSCHGIRRLGSAAADMAYVACGRFDGFYEYGLNAWDVAGGALLVKEAGGKVSDFGGGDNHLFGKQIVASGPGIYEEFLQPVKTKLFKNDPSAGSGQAK